MHDIAKKYRETPAENLPQWLTKELPQWLEENKSRLTEKNEKYNLLSGDEIDFVNGYNIPMRATITAFCKETGKAYLKWDCFWFPIDLDKRLIKQS